MKQKIALVTALASLATPVWAGTFAMGALAPFTSVSQSVTYPAVTGGYAFDDTFNFSIADDGPGIYSVGIEFQGYPAAGGYSSVEFYLRDVTGSETDLLTWYGSDFPDWSTNFFSGQSYGPLDVSHSYQVEVRGTSDSNAGGNYGLTLIAEKDNLAPVPEPETYAMFLAGLGLLGWSARRRKQN